MGLRNCTTCPPVIRAAGGLYLAAQGSLVHHAELPMPVGVARRYLAIANNTGLQYRPALIWTESLGGSVGLFAGDLIALGRRDINDVARKIWSEYFDHRSDLERYLLSELHSVRERFTYEQVVEAVLNFVIAHELGHARQAEDGFYGSAIAGEADADTFTGLMSAALDWPRTLQQFVAHAVGCTDGVLCQHPAPDERVIARDRGEALYRRIA